MMFWRCDTSNSLIGDFGGRRGGIVGLESDCVRENVSYSFPSNFVLFATGPLESSPYGLGPALMLCGIEGMRCAIVSTGGKPPEYRAFPCSERVIASSQGRFVLARCIWDCSRMRASSITVPMAMLVSCRGRIQ